MTDFLSPKTQHGPFVNGNFPPAYDIWRYFYVNSAPSYQTVEKLYWDLKHPDRVLNFGFFWKPEHDVDL